MSVEVGVRRQPRARTCSPATARPSTSTSRRSTGFAQGVPQNQRQPVLRRPVDGADGPVGGAFGWTQGIDYFCNCAKNSYNSLQTKLTKRFSHGYSLLAHYTLQRARNNDGGAVLLRPRSATTERRQLRSRSHNFMLSARRRAAVRTGQNVSCRTSRTLADAFIGGWQFNTNVVIQSGLPSTSTTATPAQTATSDPTAPNLIGDITEGGGTRDHWFNTTPIGSAGSAFGRPAIGTFGNMERGSLSGPGYWRVDASLFKRIRFGNHGARASRRGGQRLQPRQPRQPRHRNRRAGQRQPQRREDHLDRVLQPDPQRNFQFG